ncbi:damage-control phosphatase ARMT1-like [Schistocerca gregaria]|uniref:damage-control phosphatase ARMT1-like n=1 Tax=Schistocerca gregaria TaxID=7010 RepID=UPI00211F302E|nr:damage-control phosphatase ARMT1-like [Schistocerca gregaria]
MQLFEWLFNFLHICILFAMRANEDCIDVETPPGVPLSAQYMRSFAYATVKDRLPVILTQVIDHLVRDKEEIIKEHGEVAREELKTVIGAFSQLKNEIQTNKPLTPLKSNSSDIKIWNSVLEEETKNNKHKWFNSDWLFSECYMYRKVREIFELSQSLTAFDPFRKSKESGLHNSIHSIVILSDHMKKQLEEVDQLKRSDVRQALQRIVYLNLWGNRFDLSLSKGVQILITENPLTYAENFKDDILVDESDKIWEVLSEADEQNKLVDIVLDNAAYELFTDFCLADYLITASLASKVRFYVKAMPWYVSDTVVNDFHWVIKTLILHDSKNVSDLASRWKKYLDSGKWVIEVKDFWTLPYSYNKMQEIRPELYAQLSQAQLVIFKGDLNYRKLVGDINWPPTETFCNALQGFNPTNVITLRTIKADTICGLTPGQAEDTAAKNGDWLITGKYAVIQFCGKA